MKLTIAGKTKFYSKFEKAGVILFLLLDPTTDLETRNIIQPQIFGNRPNQTLTDEEMKKHANVIANTLYDEDLIDGTLQFIDELNDSISDEVLLENPKIYSYDPDILYQTIGTLASGSFQEAIFKLSRYFGYELTTNDDY